jgi:hypothetical protein
VTALAGWWRAVLNPGALVAAAAAQRQLVTAAWIAAYRGPDVSAENPGDGWRGGPGIGRFGAGK